MSSSVKINGSGTTTYLLNAALAAYLRANEQLYTMAFWWKKESAIVNDTSILSIADNATDTSYQCLAQFRIGPDRLRSFCRGNNTSSETSDGVSADVWNLSAFRFDSSAGAANAGVKASLNGGPFSVAVAPLSPTFAALDIVALGALVRTSAIQHVPSLLLARAAAWGGELSSSHLAALYGSGPAAGDGLDPRLVNKANLISSASFKDGNLNEQVGGGAWSAVGSDITTVADAPVLIEPANGRAYGSLLPQAVDVVRGRPAATRSQSVLL